MSFIWWLVDGLTWMTGLICIRIEFYPITKCRTLSPLIINLFFEPAAIVLALVGICLVIVSEWLALFKRLLWFRVKRES